jgi:hypothetical protein
MYIKNRMSHALSQVTFIVKELVTGGFFVNLLILFIYIGSFISFYTYIYKAVVLKYNLIRKIRKFRV